MNILCWCSSLGLQLFFDGGLSISSRSGDLTLFSKNEIDHDLDGLVLPLVGGQVYWSET